MPFLLREVAHRPQIEHATASDSPASRERSRAFLCASSAPDARLASDRRATRRCRASRTPVTNKPLRAAVDPRAGEQMIAGAEQGEQRARRRAHAAREQHGGFGALERGEPPLHDFGVRRVAVARIAQPFGGADFLIEVYRLKKRRDDRRVGVVFARRRRAARASRGRACESAAGRGRAGAGLRGLRRLLTFSCAGRRDARGCRDPA